MLKAAVIFGAKIVELALPLRLGICSLLSNKAVSPLNPYLDDLVTRLLEKKEFQSKEFNKRMKNKNDIRSLSIETQRMVWVLDRLAKDPILYKQTDFK